MQEYITPIHLAYTNNWILSNFTKERLDDEKSFLITLDITPKNCIDFVEDYAVILDAFPNNNRVLAKKYYIGNFKKCDRKQFIDQILQYWLYPHSYKIISAEPGLF